MYQGHYGPETTYSSNPPVSCSAPPTSSRSGKLSDEAYSRLVPFRDPVIFLTPVRLRPPMYSGEILTLPLMVEQETWVSTSSWLVRVRLPQAGWLLSGDGFLEYWEIRHYLRGSCRPKKASS